MKLLDAEQRDPEPRGVGLVYESMYLNSHRRHWTATSIGSQWYLALVLRKEIYEHRFRQSPDQHSVFPHPPHRVLL